MAAHRFADMNERMKLLVRGLQRVGKLVKQLVRVNVLGDGKARIADRAQLADSLLQGLGGAGGCGALLVYYVRVDLAYFLNYLPEMTY